MSSQFTFRECFVEFIGMLAICFFGGWAVILMANEKLTLLELVLQMASTYTIFIWVGSPYSKCHFNPAITLSFLLTKEINNMKAMFYIGSQFVGAYVGTLMLYYILPDSLNTFAQQNNAELGCPHMSDQYFFLTGICAETFGSLILCLTFLILHDIGKVKEYAIVVGIAFAVPNMSIGIITAGSVNPFRYLAPALFSLNLYDFYIYLIGPVLGAIISTIMFKALFKNNDKKIDPKKYILNNLSQTEEKKLK